MGLYLHSSNTTQCIAVKQLGLSLFYSLCMMKLLFIGFATMWGDIVLCCDARDESI